MNIKLEKGKIYEILDIYGMIKFNAKYIGLGEAEENFRRKEFAVFKRIGTGYKYCAAKWEVQGVENPILCLKSYYYGNTLNSLYPWNWDKNLMKKKKIKMLQQYVKNKL